MTTLLSKKAYFKLTSPIILPFLENSVLQKLWETQIFM